jgi:carbon storage regulator
MNKITGKPEGRPGIWLIEPAAVSGLIDTLPGDKVHNFIGEQVFIGAYWDKQSVYDLINNGGVKCTLVFPPNITMRHQLVVINDSMRWSFDVGEITEDRMQQNAADCCGLVNPEGSMLVFRRGFGESFDIGKDIRVHVISMRRGQITIGVEAPKEVKILRSELANRSPAKDLTANKP